MIATGQKKGSEEVTLPQGKPRWGRWFLWGMMTVVFVGLVGIFLYGWWFISAFEEAAGIKAIDLVRVGRSGWGEPLKAVDGRINFLFLGVDADSNFRLGSKLTDTMVIVSVAASGKDVKLVALPRDLWLTDLKTKVNALYYYGTVRPNGGAITFVQQELEKITGISLAYVLVVDLATVKQVVDTVDGIPVTVSLGFIDTKFPRDNVPPDILPEELRYETVVFTPGAQWFDGLTALKFIRSRQSEIADEGTDLARSQRQLQVIQALVGRMSSIDVLTNPRRLGMLYRIWQSTEKTFDDKELVGLGRIFQFRIPKVVSLTLPITEGERLGVLTHPPVAKYGQWVYEPEGNDWEAVRDWFRITMAN
ncbi:hypothetical protein A3A66_00400 [Microgenomates group bacterium RIFCSPLOWO2_01_FULL_46_13]|nr:MAG: hypothetical protein A2783_03920 [Microgenomates group bacterium RIFCSPHIGHO2_01_FULL_45_11]OGV94475.1 MAG: hypothetical protein A3A66_00400 [Microgenomates group bacterium RIFCSPLOWO2_01_FULL_46_13]